MNSAQDRIDQIEWYHDFDFPNGLRARSAIPEAESHRALWGWIRHELAQVNFDHKNVLDIGCWDGYWSFYAKQRGAARVLAADDETQNYAANSGLDLAAELMGELVEIRTDVSIYEASKLNQKFDVILCLGVYYHLVDPFHAFAQLRHCCENRGLLILEGDFAPEAPSESAFYHLGDPIRCFTPSLSCLRQLLEACYFQVVGESVYTGTAEHPLNRALLTCRPFVDENPRHCTRPPFGLHAYDFRFHSPLQGR